MKKLQLALGASTLLFSVQLFAEEAPVEDLSQPAYIERPEMRLSTDERIQRLEQQVRNLNRGSQSSRLDEMQDAVQELKGQLDKAQHDLQVLSDTQKKFYSDLNSRIGSGSSPQKTAEQQEPTAPAAHNDVVSDNKVPLTAKENEAYRQAFDLLKTKQYDGAIAAFQRYLMEYPGGSYVVNSNYWLGEVYYLQGKSADAKKAFTVVITNFPQSNKVGDALLKLAIISLDAGNTAQGREMLSKVQKEYPGTTAARLAALRSQELKLNS